MHKIHEKNLLLSSYNKLKLCFLHYSILLQQFLVKATLRNKNIAVNKVYTSRTTTKINTKKKCF